MTGVFSKRGQSRSAITVRSGSGTVASTTMFGIVSERTKPDKRTATYERFGQSIDTCQSIVRCCHCRRRHVRRFGILVPDR